MRGTIKHGHTSRKRGWSQEYIAWKNMIARCYRPSSQRYKAYGARGIKVCARWRESFENFLQDMGLKPSRDHVLERKEVNGDYSPENCVWIHKSKQMLNMRHTRYVDVDGTQMPLVEAAKLKGLPYHRVKMRLRRGWTDAEALS